MELFISLPATHVLAFTAQCFAIPPPGGSARVLLFSLSFPCGVDQLWHSLNPPLLLNSGSACLLVEPKSFLLWNTPPHAHC